MLADLKGVRIYSVYNETVRPGVGIHCVTLDYKYVQVGVITNQDL